MRLRPVARGSRSRLFALIYGVGILVTVFLSNDATAVALTPAVYAAVKKARTEALPYLLSCAFIAKCGELRAPNLEPRQSRRLRQAAPAAISLAQGVPVAVAGIRRRDLCYAAADFAATTSMARPRTAPE
jgi:hypothetical protein